MHKSLNKRLHELSADQITLSPEKLKPSGNLYRSSFYTSDKSLNDKTELIHEIPAQDTILNIPLGLLSLDLNYKQTLVKIQKQPKRIDRIQPHLNQQRLLVTTIADIKHQDPFSLTWFTTHEEPLPIWALYLHMAQGKEMSSQYSVGQRGSSGLARVWGHVTLCVQCWGVTSDRRPLCLTNHEST